MTLSHRLCERCHVIQFFLFNFCPKISYKMAGLMCRAGGSCITMLFSKKSQGGQPVVNVVLDVEPQIVL